MALERVLNGALSYACTGRNEFLKKLKSLPKTTAVVISCVDSRVFPANFLSTEPGDTFIIRNPGNFVPPVHPKHDPCDVLSTLELACVRGEVDDIFVCGHSDCKAMHLLNSMGRSVVNHKLQLEQMSPLQKWIAVHGMEGFYKYDLGKAVLDFPVRDIFRLSFPLSLKLSSLTDLSTPDQLSQINVVQQMSHIYSHSLLIERLLAGTLRIHGLWFHIHSAQVHMLSRPDQRFIPVTRESVPLLLKQSTM
ncbi:unnamed protein product [Dicrocoelium dendriticum]|nr:unnamed protein product [Dicrocoelium dendriticum]